LKAFLVKLGGNESFFGTFLVPFAKCKQTADFLQKTAKIWALSLSIEVYQKFALFSSKYGFH